MNKPQKITGNDIERLARDFGKPGSESLRKKVFDRIDEIDREVALGKRPPLPERNTPSAAKRTKERGIGRGDD